MITYYQVYPGPGAGPAQSHCTDAVRDLSESLTIYAVKDC